MSIAQASAMRGREPQRCFTGPAMDPSEPSKRAAPIPKSGGMGIAKNTTPAPKARQSPASDFSLEGDDNNLRPIGDGRSKAA